MFQIHSFPTAILHLDGDAFFASVIQAVNPSLKGKPVIVGKERGIATAVSYEAKRLGVKRGMGIWDIKKIYPNCHIIESDYETYSIFSKKMFEIMERFLPAVEKYSIDEGFADIKGLRRPLNMGYYEIGKKIKERVEYSLGITVSIGISLTKSLAKIASAFEKPSGLTMIEGPFIESFLKKTPVNDVWGIGLQTSSFLKKIGVNTAFDFASKSEEFIKKNLTKPFFEIWQELRGKMVYEVNPSNKEEYKSMTKSQTFSPPINNPDILWARLLKHIEDAFEKARRFNYKVGKVAIFLKTQNFRYFVKEVRLNEKTDYPYLIRNETKEGFHKIYKKEFLYRTTGCTIYDFANTDDDIQPNLFTNKNFMEKKVEKFYPLYEKKKIDFGSSFFDTKNNNEDRVKKLGLPFVNINMI